MAKIISVGKDTWWRKFNSLDLFTKLLIITLILLAIVTPFIVNNYQLFNIYGQTGAQRLREIAQLQESQGNIQNATSSFAGGFGLIDDIRKIFMRIAQIFN